MSKYIPSNQKHLSLEERIYIVNPLNMGYSFKDNASYLCKDPTAISKEIIRRTDTENFTTDRQNWLFPRASAKRRPVRMYTALQKQPC